MACHILPVLPRPLQPGRKLLSGGNPLVQHWLDTKLPQSLSKLKRRLLKTLGVEQHVSGAWIVTCPQIVTAFSFSLFLNAMSEKNADAMADVSLCHSTAE